MSHTPAEPSKRASWRSLFVPISRRPLPPPSTHFDPDPTPDGDRWERIERPATVDRKRGSLASLFGLGKFGDTSRTMDEGRHPDVDEIGTQQGNRKGLARSGTITRLVGKFKNGSKGSRGSIGDVEPREDTSVWRRSMSRASRDFGSLVRRGKEHEGDKMVSANAPRHSLQDHVRVCTSISSVFPITPSPPRLSLDFPRSTSFFDDNSPIQSRIETLATVNEDITPKRRPLGILTNLPPRLLTPTKRSKVPNLDKTPRNTTPALLTTKNKTPITKKKTSITTVLVPESSPEIQGRPSMELCDAVSATSDLESLLHSSSHHSSDSPTPSLRVSANPSLESLISTTLEYLGGLRRSMVEESRREVDVESVRSRSTFGKGGSGFSTPDRTMSVVPTELKMDMEDEYDSEGTDVRSEDDEDLVDEDVEFVLTPTHLVKTPLGTPPPSPITPSSRVMSKASLVPSPGETTPITALLLLLSPTPLSPTSSLPPSTPTPSTPPPLPPTLPLFSTTPRTPFRPIVPLELRTTSPFKRQFSPIEVFQATGQKRRLEDLFDEIESDLEVTPTRSPRSSPRRSDRPKIEPLRFSRRAAVPPPPPPTFDLDTSTVTTRRKRRKTIVPPWIVQQDTIVEEESWQVLDSPGPSSTQPQRPTHRPRIVSPTRKLVIRERSEDPQEGLGHLIYEATQEVASSRSLWPTSTPPRWTRPRSHGELEKFLSDSRQRFQSIPSTPDRMSILHDEGGRREEGGNEGMMESLGNRMETTGFKRTSKNPRSRPRASI